MDGSPSSRAALGWAIRQAELTGAVVDAVTAWRFPPQFAWAPDGLAAAEFEAAARRQLTEAIGEVSGAEPAVEVRPSVMAGHPAQVLVEAARGAELLVVGCRGHGGFTGALLGSVSSHCVHHAPCPVLVMRREAARSGKNRASGSAAWCCRLARGLGPTALGARLVSGQPGCRGVMEMADDGRRPARIGPAAGGGTVVPLESAAARVRRGLR